MTLQPRSQSFDSYEVYDEDGHSVGQVILPRNLRPFGRTKGTVYLQRPPVTSPQHPHAA